MREQWDNELRNMLYESDNLDVAARSNAVTTIDSILGAYDLATADLTKQLGEVNAKLADSQSAMTRLVLENSRHVTNKAVTPAAPETPVAPVVEVLDDAAALAAALDEGDGE